MKPGINSNKYSLLVCCFFVSIGISSQFRSPTSCEIGFEFIEETKQCEDINECSSSRFNNCKKSQVCINTIGSFVCIAGRLRKMMCPQGSKYDKFLNVCVDVNECEGNPCNENEECVNTRGSYECVECDIGFEFSEGSCRDIDECALLKHNCSMRGHEKCINKIGSFYCVCRNGYQRNEETGACEDIDECIFANSCPLPNNHCVNTLGSYRCSCGRGYAQRGHLCVLVDHCVSNPCPNGSKCLDFGDSYSCMCPSGFEFDESYSSCIDINECESDGLYCDVCQNTIGSFECKCKEGQEWSPPLGHCIPIKGCESIDHKCSESKHERCVIESGSHSCVCLDGFKRSDTTGDCEDIDECGSLTSNCVFPKECKNTIGSFICKCSPGFIEKEENCEKVESSGNDDSCSRGFQINRSTNECEDIDECLTNSHDCPTNKHCINEIGGYSCTIDAKHDVNEVTDDIADVTFAIGDVTTNKQDITEAADGEPEDKEFTFNPFGVTEAAAGEPEVKDDFTLNPLGITDVAAGEPDVTTSKTLSRRGETDSNAPNTPNTCKDGYEFNKNLNICEFTNECKGEHSCPDSEMCTNSYPGHRCTHVHCSHPYAMHPAKKHACIKKNSDRDRSLPLLIQYNAIGLRNNETVSSDGLPVFMVNVTDVDCEFSLEFNLREELKNNWSLIVHNMHQVTLVLRTAITGPQTMHVFVDCNAWGLIAQRSFIYVFVSEN